VGFRRGVWYEGKVEEEKGGRVEEGNEEGRKMGGKDRFKTWGWEGVGG